MEQFDREKAKRVWQRVQAGSPMKEVAMSEGALAAAEMGESALYIKLSQRMRGGDSQVLRKIAMEDRQHAGILRGICRMNGGENIPKPGNVLQTGSLGQQLRVCYGRKMQIAAEYEKRMEDGQFGNVFAKLAENERSHCRSLLMLIGKY